MAGAAHGDLLLNVKVQTHAFFKRRGDDIHIDLPLTFIEAARGAKVSVPTIDGRVTMTIPPGTRSGQELRLRGRGAPKPDSDERGDEYVRIEIVVPDKLDNRQRELLDEFAETWDRDPRASLPKGL